MDFFPLFLLQFGSKIDHIQSLNETFRSTTIRPPYYVNFFSKEAFMNSLIMENIFIIDILSFYLHFYLTFLIKRNWKEKASHGTLWKDQN